MTLNPRLFDLKIALPALLILAFAIRLAAVFALQTPLISDVGHYDRLAVSLADGKGYIDAEGNPTAFWPVGNPAFLAAIYLIFGHSVFAATIVNAALGTLTVLLTYLLAAQFLVNRQALLAAAIVTFLPSHVLIFPPSLWSENLYAPLVLLTLLIALRLFRNPTWRNALLLGVVIGLGAHVRPVLPLFPALL